MTLYVKDIQRQVLLKSGVQKRGAWVTFLNNRLSWFIDYSFSLCLTWRYGYLFVSTTLRWGFWTHTIFGPGWWVYMYKQWKSDVKCPWVTLEVDAEVSSVRELTVFWLFFLFRLETLPFIMLQALDYINVFKYVPYLLC